MPEHSGLNIDLFGDIFVCPRMKTHGYCERHSPRPGKQTITPRVALCRRSNILFYLYIMYLKQYNYRMYQTCNKRGDIYLVYYMSTIKSEYYTLKSEPIQASQFSKQWPELCKSGRVLS